MVVEAAGSVANTEWLDSQGLDLSDGVLCDGDLHPLGHDGPVGSAVALGDVARFPIPMFGATPYRVEHWTMPTDTAGHAARSLLSQLTGEPVPGPAFSPVPTFWSDLYGTRVQCFGMPSLGMADVRVLEGDLAGEAAVGFYCLGRLVGVILLGLPRRMMAYRQLLLEAQR